MSRRFFIREAIQTSAMDCGPAALKALLEGYDIHCSYGRLREACQTEIDGTSIDTIEAAAVQLGLDAAQVMLPFDHLLDPQAKVLPAVVVVRNPDGATHFVVVWRRHGRWLQVMDSAVGRRWVPVSRFLDEVYAHTMTVSATAWREWAGSESFLATLRRRIAAFRTEPDALIAAACADASAQSLSRLDAATRMTETLAAQRVVKRGGEAARVLATLISDDVPIADEYWSAIPDAAGENVRIKGAVLIQVMGRRAMAALPQNLAPELAAALNEKPAHPLADFFRQSFDSGAFAPRLILVAFAVSAAAVAGEAILLRAFFDLGARLTNVGERVGGLAALMAFSGALLALEFSLWKNLLHLGRRLECRLRVLVQTKLPRLEDRYFRSRPVSDLADRSHNVHQLRQAPELAAHFLRAVLELMLTTAAIAWLYPMAAFYACGIAVVAIGVPLAAQPLLTERDLRMRTHAGALTRFYLDTLLGLTAIRCHDAARPVRHEQSNLLGTWARAGLDLQRAVTAVEGVQFGGSLLLAAWLVWSVVGTAGDPSGLLLLVYWVLNLPALGQEAAVALWQYPMLRNTALRLTEPLGAPEDADTVVVPAQDDEKSGDESPHSTCGAEQREVPESRSSIWSAATCRRFELAATSLAPAFPAAPHLRWENVTVRAGGHEILKSINLDIKPGSHVGIVGMSGAGKSSLVGLLLGWHKPSEGRLLVNAQLLEAEAFAQLRRVTAWVDPQVQIWNRSLYENILYGCPGDAAFDEILRTAELRGVVQALPDGLQTVLGESGGLVSGGEGQRVRLARGLARADARLVLLDEPARGLDRHSRREMIRRARERWHDATLLCVTHDISDTRDFNRVLVMSDARLIEDGRPSELEADKTSLYRRLLDTEDTVRRELWSNPVWRHLRLQHGRLEDVAPVSTKRIMLRGEDGFTSGNVGAPPAVCGISPDTFRPEACRRDADHLLGALAVAGLDEAAPASPTPATGGTALDGCDTDLSRRDAGAPRNGAEEQGPNGATSRLNGESHQLP